MSALVRWSCHRTANRRLYGSNASQKYRQAFSFLINSRVSLTTDGNYNELCKGEFTDESIVTVCTPLMSAV